MRLVAHINGTHHKYTRDEIARPGPLFDKGVSVHGMNHPELQLQHITATEVRYEI